MDQSVLLSFNAVCVRVRALACVRMCVGVWLERQKHNRTGQWADLIQITPFLSFQCNCAR